MRGVVLTGKPDTLARTPGYGGLAAWCGRGNWQIDSVELENHLRGEDDVGVVIRGHLGLENALNTLLEVGLPKGLSNLENLRFPARVDLAIATGLLDPAGRSAWLLVNELRNRVAHDLDGTLDKAVSDKLESALALRPEKTMGLILPAAREGGLARESGSAGR